MTAPAERAPEQEWPASGGYSASGNSWLCPEPGCGFGVAGLNSPVSDWGDPYDVDPVGEHLRMHDERAAAAAQDVMREALDAARAADHDPAARPPQHARPSRRSSLMLGRVLVGLGLAVLGVVVSVCLASILSDGLMRPSVAATVLAWIFVVPGVVVLLACAGVAALAAFEAWYERRGGGAR